MSDHIENLIDAFLDGELNNEQKRMLEVHLEQCTTCQALVAQRRRLIEVIREVPAARNIKLPEYYAEKIVSELNDVPYSTSGWVSEFTQWLRDVGLMRRGWLAVPVSLLLASVFVQTVGFLTSVLTLLPGTKPILFQAANTLSPVTNLQLDQPISSLLGDMVGFNLGQWTLFTNLVVSAAIGLLYLAWIASFLMDRQSTETVSN